MTLFSPIVRCIQYRPPGLLLRRQVDDPTAGWTSIIISCMSWGSLSNHVADPCGSGPGTQTNLLALRALAQELKGLSVLIVNRAIISSELGPSTD